jgi:hypothetical protein
MRREPGVPRLATVQTRNTQGRAPSAVCIILQGIVEVHLETVDTSKCTLRLVRMSYSFSAVCDSWLGSTWILERHSHSPSNIARSDFSLNTCNGCHARETANQLTFQHVVNRTPSSGSPSVLSAFLVGCNNGGTALTTPCPSTELFPLTAPGQENVQDPVVSKQTNTFGDLVRRATYLSSVLGENCNAEKILQSFVQHKESLFTEMEATWFSVSSGSA